VIALDIRGLSRHFGGVQALSQVSMSVQTGERRLVIGPNGAGKTTLFNMVAGTFQPSAGTVLLWGKDITRAPAYVRARMGLARTFQITNLFSRLSVFDNLLLALNAGEPTAFSMQRPIRANRAMYRRAEALLDNWGLTAIAGRGAREVSYGEQRQVDLMLAMACEPKLLLLDEPMAGLSAAEAARVIGMIHALPREMTILMIEHDVDLAFDLADRISVLHQGQLIAEGAPDEIRGHPQVSEIYLGMD
jgi:branched-chain amino acid transport system ATP-binding protein